MARIENTLVALTNQVKVRYLTPAHEGDGPWLHPGALLVFACQEHYHGSAAGLRSSVQGLKSFGVSRAR